MSDSTLGIVAVSGLEPAKARRLVTRTEAAQILAVSVVRFDTLKRTKADFPPGYRETRTAYAKYDPEEMAAYRHLRETRPARRGRPRKEKRETSAD